MGGAGCAIGEEGSKRQLIGILAPKNFISLPDTNTN